MIYKPYRRFVNRAHRLLKRTPLAWMLMMFFGIASAEPLPEMVILAIDKSPALLAARADIQRAKATAKRLKAGPYEFNANATQTRRDVNDVSAVGTEFEEWSIGINRTVRLPSKRRVDKKLAVMELELAHASYDKALLESKLNFISLWTQWRKSKALLEVSTQRVIDASKMADMEQKNVVNGAGRQINADRLRAEAHLYEVQANQDRLSLTNAQTTITTLYPSLNLENLKWEYKPSRDLLLKLKNAGTADTPALKIAQLRHLGNQLNAKRAKLDRIPDPTLGLSLFDEFNGMESGIMAQLSFPLPGRRRAAIADEANRSVEVSELTLESIQHQQELTLTTAKQRAEAALTSFLNAESAVLLSRKSLNSIVNGYDLGVVTLGDVINARRLHQKIERDYQSFRFDNINASLILMSMVSD